MTVFSDHARLAEALMPAVLRAGAIEMAYFGGAFAVDRKADKSPVTAADREAEVAIVEGLAAAAPGIPVIAEEMAAEGLAPPPGEVFFLVDPLDGTREFIRGGREFTINIGLVSGGRPVFGLIYAPAIGQLYVTTGARDAVVAETPSPDMDPSQILGLARPMRTRTADPLALSALESRSRASPGLDAILKRHKVAERQQAASSYKFCLVADGLSDVYVQFGRTCEWDTAAGEAILVASGGAVTALDGQPLAYGREDQGFLNPPFIAWGRKAVQPW